MFPYLYIEEVFFRTLREISSNHAYWCITVTRVLIRITTNGSISFLFRLARLIYMFNNIIKIHTRYVFGKKTAKKFSTRFRIYRASISIFGIYSKTGPTTAIRYRKSSHINLPGRNYFHCTFCQCLFVSSLAITTVADL